MDAEVTKELEVTETKELKALELGIHEGDERESEREVEQEGRQGSKQVTKGLSNQVVLRQEL
jgi:hypothetical protein